MSLRIVYFLSVATMVVFGASGAKAYTLDNNGIVLDNEGHLLLASQRDAIRACPVGTHLPSAREFANDAHARGARGTAEMPHTGFDQAPAGYDTIWSSTLQGQRDDFYFNSKGYHRPQGDLGKYCFWTSSLAHFEIFRGYCFNGKNAYFVTLHTGVNFLPVRCIPTAL